MLRRLLGLVDVDLAVLLLDHGGVERADGAGGMELEDSFVVGLGIGDFVVDGGVEEDGSFGHGRNLSVMGRRAPEMDSCL